uniref:UPF0695 membrane protein YOR390W n=2 Tax=Lygus hesperus TaxID=30085 RepID=A0A146LRE4_LYGHE
MELTSQDTDSPTRNRTTAGIHHEEEENENITSAKGDNSNAGAASSTIDVLCICVSLGFGTLLGLLSRTGVIIVSNELLKTELSGIVWTNFVACFCMGLFVKTSSIFELPKTHNVYMGLTTGYCGTFSSFSSAALELFDVAAGRIRQTPIQNSTESSHETTPILIGKNLSNFAGSAFVHIGLSFIGYHLGETTAMLISRDVGRGFLQGCRYHSLSLKIAAISVLSMMIISSLLETYFFRTSNYFIYISSALLLALPGTSLRYYLSKKLNFDKRNNQKRIFPLGTLTANVLGSLVLATSTLLTLGIKPKKSLINFHNEMIITDKLSCCILSGVGHGFCGALTTMSTFISELTVMENRIHLYFYSILTVLITVGSFTIVWGTYSWTVGYVMESPCL